MARKTQSHAATSPAPWGPSRMPALRDELVAYRWQMGRLWQYALDEAAARVAADVMPEMDGGLSSSVHAARTASMWWVSKDMTDLAATAAQSIPQVDLGRALPGSSGLLMWGRPLDFLQGVLWRVGDSEIELLLLSSDLTKHWIGRITMDHIGHFGTIQHPYGVSTDAPPVVKLLATTCVLMAQPGIANCATIVRAHRDPGSGRKSIQPVQVINLRRLEPADSAPGDDGHQSWSHRWMVSGHWRNQACGPAHTERRPTWVMPYLKGPDGAPIKDRVHAWRR